MGQDSTVRKLSAGVNSIPANRDQTSHRPPLSFSSRLAHAVQTTDTAAVAWHNESKKILARIHDHAQEKRTKFGTAPWGLEANGRGAEPLEKDGIKYFQVESHYLKYLVRADGTAVDYGWTDLKFIDGEKQILVGTFGALEFLIDRTTGAPLSLGYFEIKRNAQGRLTGKGILHTEAVAPAEV